VQVAVGEWFLMQDFDFYSEGTYMNTYQNVLSALWRSAIVLQMATLWWNKGVAFNGVKISYLLLETEAPLLVEQRSLFLWSGCLGENNNLTGWVYSCSAHERDGGGGGGGGFLNANPRGKGRPLGVIFNWPPGGKKP